MLEGGEVAQWHPFTQTQAVRPGMAMFSEEGGYDLVESVDWVPLDAPVYDLDVEATTSRSNSRA